MNEQENFKKFNQAIEILPVSIKSVLLKIDLMFKKSVSEIRFRTNKPVTLSLGAKNICIDLNGTACGKNQAWILNNEEIKDIFHALCDGSIYSHQDDINSGYITLKGGHRAGVCGQAIYSERGISVKSVNSVNLRIARQYRGCADSIIKIFRERKIFSLLDYSCHYYTKNSHT